MFYEKSSRSIASHSIVICAQIASFFLILKFCLWHANYRCIWSSRTFACWNRFENELGILVEEIAENIAPWVRQRLNFCTKYFFRLCLAHFVIGSRMVLISWSSGCHVKNLSSPSPREGFCNSGLRFKNKNVFLGTRHKTTLSISELMVTQKKHLIKNSKN